MTTDERPDVRVERPEEGLVLLVLDRAEGRNALRHRTMLGIADALDEADRDESVRCALIVGSERFFAAGADIHEMAELDGPALAVHPRTEAWKRIGRVGVPIVAAVEGLAAGGGNELVLASDVVIAGEGARFAQPEITLGWMPGAGGTQRLPRAVGKATAMRMVLTGEPLDARAALAAGLVSEVVATGEAHARALVVARRIASLSRLATREAKASVKRAFELPLHEGLEAEREAFFRLASSEDRAEGIRAFLEKRAPVFRGR